MGARPLVERLRLEWRPGTPIRAPSGRLSFRQTHGRDEMVALMTLVLDGTLDAHSRDDLTHMTPDRGSRRALRPGDGGYRSPQAWWRIATLPDGEPVGFVTPARNDYNPIIGYIAVLPEHRGNGYIDDLLAEGTPDPRSRRRAANPRVDRHGQRADGRGLRAGRLRHL